MNTSRIINHLSPFTLLLAFLVLLPWQTFASEYYISKAGVDSNTGSFESPWKTISKANTELEPGDTVFIRSGQYEEQIKPSKSGAEGAYITYSGYLTENPKITNSPGGLAINLVGRSYIKVEKLEVNGKNLWPNANLNTWVLMDNSNHNVIQNNTMQFGDGPGIKIDNGSKYNKIIGNTLDGIGTLDDGSRSKGDVITVQGGSSFNLVEGNTLTRGGHNLFVTVSVSYNIIRNNIFNNQWSDTTGYRALTLKSRDATDGWNVFEHNIVKNSLTSIHKGDPAGLKVEGKNQIVRNNIIFNNSEEGITGGSRDGDTTCVDNKIFNNTFYNNGGPAWLLREYSGSIPITGNIFKNNIVYKNRIDPDSSNLANDLVILISGKLGNSLISSNAIVKSSPGDAKVYLKDSGGSMSLSNAESDFSGSFKGNLQVEPKFVSSSPNDKDDFELTSGSELIDAGEYLTYTTSNGTGKEVTVIDAGYFTDGHNLISGDMIQVGNNSPVKITDVNYSNNTITVSSEISWDNEDGVSLQYNGSGVDIGALEYGAVDYSPPKPPKNIEARVL